MADHKARLALSVAVRAHIAAGQLGEAKQILAQWRAAMPEDAGEYERLALDLSEGLVAAMAAAAPN
jgi:hypothetical protein